MLNLRSEQRFKGVKQDVKNGHIYRVLYALKHVGKLPGIRVFLKTLKKTITSLFWAASLGVLVNTNVW